MTTMLTITRKAAHLLEDGERIDIDGDIFTVENVDIAINDSFGGLCAAIEATDEAGETTVIITEVDDQMAVVRD